MMKKNKHSFHCNKCDSSCMIYKKGKNHRVLVCPECGVLATNGIFSKEAYAKRRSSKFGKLLKPVHDVATSAVGYVPFIGDPLQSKIIEDTSSVRPVKSTPPRQGRTTYDNLDKPNKGERYVRLALGGK